MMDRTFLFTVILSGMALMLVPYIVDLIMMRLDKKPTIIDIIKRLQQEEGLISRVREARLGKMLPIMGINMDDYIMDVPEYDVRKHIARCGACKLTPICDQCLHSREQMGDMSFCPNNTSLKLYHELIEAQT